MTKTVAQRQADFRKRHLVEGRRARLSAIVDVTTKKALLRLAAAYQVTERKMLEQLIAAAEEQAVKKIVELGQNPSEYYNLLMLEPLPGNETTEKRGE
jgi:hypothetical protein